MKQYIQSLILQGIDALKASGAIPADFVPKVMVEASKDKTHGDYASNIAMLLRKPMGLAPREAAEKLVAALPESDRIAKVEIAGPGFINFYANAGYLESRIESMLSDGGRFGVAKAASPRLSSATTHRRMSPRRWPFTTSDQLSSATPAPGCSSSSATMW